MISKTGRAEISEDPMGPEQSDVLDHAEAAQRVDQRENQAGARSQRCNASSASSRGCSLSFSQPIALRVNELISGVKSDLAVKIFGEDIAQLKQYADQAAAVLGGIRGAKMPASSKSPAWSRSRSPSIARRWRAMASASRT